MLVQAISPLPPDSLARLEALAEYAALPKGTALFTDAKLADEVYFLHRGLARAYARREDREVTFWFSDAGAVLVSIRGYIERAVSYETIELLEDSELYRVRAGALQALYATDVHLANWGRRLVEQCWLQTEQQLIGRQFKTATERYVELLEHSPHLLRRVALGHIASYLGISQVTLSRVRATRK